jgi:hypothetical protein
MAKNKDGQNQRWPKSKMAKIKDSQNQKCPKSKMPEIKIARNQKRPKSKIPEIKIAGNQKCRCSILFQIAYFRYFLRSTIHCTDPLAHSFLCAYVFFPAAKVSIFYISGNDYSCADCRLNTFCNCI